MKSKSIFRQNGSNHLLVIPTTTVLLLFVIGFLFYRNYSNHQQSKSNFGFDKSQTNDARHVPVNDKASSDKNIEIMLDAASSRDIKMCDEIKGSVNYTNPNLDSTDGSAHGVVLVTPAMTQTEARENCHKHVQSLIDRDSYEVKVCNDHSVTHYEYDGVTFPCPSR